MKEFIDINTIIDKVIDLEYTYIKDIFTIEYLGQLIKTHMAKIAHHYISNHISPILDQYDCPRCNDFNNIFLTRYSLSAININDQCKKILVLMRGFCCACRYSLNRPTIIAEINNNRQVIDEIKNIKLASNSYAYEEIPIVIK